MSNITNFVLEEDNKSHIKIVHEDVQMTEQFSDALQNQSEIVNEQYNISET